MKMSIYQRMMYVILSITVVCAVSMANNIYIPTGSRVPDTVVTNDFYERYYDTNRLLIKNFFPYEEEDYLLEVPKNMSYTTKTFQQFEGTYLTASKTKANENYLKKICFCGDSLTYHMGRTGKVLSSYDVVAYGGLTVADYLKYNKAPTYNKSNESESLDKYKTTGEWLSELQPEIIYLMLGTNGMMSYTLDTHIKLYSDLLNTIHSLCPGAIIVICSVVPWGNEAYKYSQDPAVTNAKIADFNQLLLELAKEKGYYFLNGAECMMDDDGFLKKEYKDGDNLHWTDVGRVAYIDYLLEHPIPGF